MALFKLLLILVLLYFAAKAVRNLVRAALHDPQAPPRVPPHRQTRRPQWQGPTPASNRHEGEDIEDARWEDLS